MPKNRNPNQGNIMKVSKQRNPPLPPSVLTPPGLDLPAASRGIAAPIYEAIGYVDLQRACEDIANGVATIESAIQAISGHSRVSIWRAMKASEAALDKLDAGARLTDREFRSIYFCSQLLKADAAGTTTLLKRAQGIGPKGVTNVRENGAALQILRLRLQAVELQRSAWLEAELRKSYGSTTAPAEEQPSPAQLEAAIRRGAAAMGMDFMESPQGAADDDG